MLNKVYLQHLFKIQHGYLHLHFYFHPLYPFHLYLYKIKAPHLIKYKILFFFNSTDTHGDNHDDGGEGIRKQEEELRTLEEGLHR